MDDLERSERYYVQELNKIPNIWSLDPHQCRCSGDIMAVEWDVEPHYLTNMKCLISSMD